MSKNKDTLKVKGIDSKGFGKIPKLVMQDTDLSIEAKGIYAYFASYAGAGETAFPSVSKTIYDLNIGRNRYYKHRKQLEDKGYISIEKVRSDGDFDKNIYTLNNEIACIQNGYMQNGDMQNADMQNQYTNNNNSNNNSIKKNSSKKDSQKSQKRYSDDSPYIKLAERLYKHLKSRNPEHKEPNWQTWADDFRKAHKLDGRSIKNLAEVIDWSQNNDFWQNNIMSAQKVRKQYDKLKLQMNTNRNRTTGGYDTSEYDNFF